MRYAPGYRHNDIIVLIIGKPSIVNMCDKHTTLVIPCDMTDMRGRRAYDSGRVSVCSGRHIRDMNDGRTALESCKMTVVVAHDLSGTDLLHCMSP